MRIIDPSQAIPVDHPVILLVGEWGIGKSSLGYSLNTLLFDFDDGAARAVNRRYTAVPTRWADVEVQARVFAGRTAVTIDTVEGCLEMLTADILATQPRCGSNGELNQRGWGVLKRRFARFLAQLRANGLDVLLLAHARQLREGDHVRTVARIPGGSYHEVMRIAHVVGHLHFRNGQRVIDFNLTDRFQGKNPGQWPVVDVPPAEQAREFMAAMFDQARTVLGAAAATSADAARDVNAWRAAIAQLETPAQFHQVLLELRAAKGTTPAAVYAQAQHLFRARMTAAGVEWASGGFRCVGRSVPVVPPSRAAARVATVQPQLYSELTTAGGAR